MQLDFEGFHPNDINSQVKIGLTDSGVEYTNIRTGAFQFIHYSQIAGFSGWIPNYGSLHIYSNNPNLTIHLNFHAEVAAEYLNSIKSVITARMSGTKTAEEMVAM